MTRSARFANAELAIQNVAFAPWLVIYYSIWKNVRAKKRIRKIDRESARSSRDNIGGPNFLGGQLFTEIG